MVEQRKRSLSKSDGGGVFSLPPLVNIDEAPSFLRFNKHVHTGYRKHYTLWQCLVSFFQIHNETCNVYTHLVPMFLFSGLWYPLGHQWMAEFELFEGMFLLFSVSVPALTSLFGSVCYHSCMSSARTVKEYRSWLIMDIIGACFGLVGTALPIIEYGMACYSTRVRVACMVAYVLLAITCLRIAVVATNSKTRLYALLLLLFFRNLTWASRALGLYDGCTVALEYHIGSLVWWVVGGVVNVSRIPERFWPGKFDYFMNSHNIWHLMTWAGAYCAYMGVWKDFEHRTNFPCAA